ncbi:MAG TPA: hypothetical protein VFA77_16040 [Candidatus Eisenbacteria bacterium]|nr:hypothetical protein [Candidatus Eisenbacteria bacterium]
MKKSKKKHETKAAQETVQIAESPNPGDASASATAFAEAKPEEAQSAPRVGTEAWLKLVVVVLAFLFLSGHAAQKAFTQSFNLQPEDFAWSERDYLVHGLRYILPDSRASFVGWREYLGSLPWPLWAIYALQMPLIFLHRGKAGQGHWHRWGATMVRSVLLLGAALLLDVASAREGATRAQRVNRSDLPLVIVYFQNPACETITCRLEGKLLSRNKKMVFVVNPAEFITCSFTETNFPPGQLILIPADKIVRLETQIPIGWSITENNNANKHR